MDRRIWTVGHSNHELALFLAMLQEPGIEVLADVRRFPGSKRQPQFQQDALREALIAAGIDYRHFPGLGGRRGRSGPDSPNKAWRVESFNAYADHMQSTEFRSALAELEEAARERATAIMCSEAVPWRCHRRLVADALLAHGWRVLDIYSPGRVKEHKLTEFARVLDDCIIYPTSDASR